MLELIQGTELAGRLYTLFHVLAIVGAFVFNVFYRRRFHFSVLRTISFTALLYGSIYLLMHFLAWAESGFTQFGDKNIVRTFVYIPIFSYFFSKLLKLDFKKILDFLPPFICVAVGVSRIGCIFTGCCRGYPCKWGLYNHVYRGNAFPVQIFEILTIFLIFSLTVFLNEKRILKEGSGYPVMLVLYGSTRFFFEFARNNEKLWLGCSSLSFHALFMTLVGAIWLYCILKKSDKPRNLEKRKRRKKKR